ncbi:MAG: hypothetical protein BMS9Abin36_2088 [Gammaproteobacteria bacterium]|nr:MAG: hypothetical protein BMS9Abin36_2088 [Gammaproteobacteria bacterium]
MSHQMWIYHDTEDAKVIDSDDFDALLSSGWRDHPNRQSTEDELESLKTEAGLLRIKVTGHATVASLRKKISETKSYGS